MEKRDKLIEILSHENDPVIDHGFDLTCFKPGDFEKILEELDLDLKPTVDNLNLCIDVPFTHFMWRNSNISITTANNPITGKPMVYNGVGYASYIGITGKKHYVIKAVKLINGCTNPKDESPGERRFI